MSSSTDKVLPFDDGGPLDESTPTRSPAPRQSPQQPQQSVITPQKSIAGASPAIKQLKPPDVRDRSLLPTLARAELEEKYISHQFQQWMDSGELLFYQACVFSTAVVSIAESSLYSQSAWLGVRLFAGAACILVVLLSIVVKAQLHRREASASFILTAILAVRTSFTRGCEHFASTLCSAGRCICLIHNHLPFACYKHHRCCGGASARTRKGD